MCFVPLTQRVRSFVAVEAGAAAEIPKGPSEGLSQWLTGKESACKAGDMGDAGTIPGSPRHLPDPGIKPRSPALQADSSPYEPPGEPHRGCGKPTPFWQLAGFTILLL